MKPYVKGIAIALIHLCLVGALGAKFLYDRATLPRVWARAAPYDPNLPIRGRYVSLQIVVEPQWVEEAKPENEWRPPHGVTLRVEGNRLLADAKPKSDLYDPSDLHVRGATLNNEDVTVLDERLAFFIPEHVPDPSVRPTGEQLMVEVTIPRKGVPRPIQLGVSKGGGPIEPLDLR